MANTKPATLCRACNEQPANSPDYPGFCRWESCEKVGFAQATDTKLAELHQKSERAAHHISSAVDSIHSAVGDEREPDRYGYSRGQWNLSLDACLALPAKYAYQAEGLAKDKAALPGLRAELATIEAAIAVEDAKYTGWSRFFLCVSSDGHIHSSTGCSTCTYKTRFAWLPTLSGLDEAAAVREHGAKLCTVCYPSAPVEWTNFFESAAAAKKAEQCAGSGKYPTREAWNRCPVCGRYGRPTRNGKVRAHKAEKVSA
jgi:hypothetical protein